MLNYTHENRSISSVLHLPPRYKLRLLLHLHLQELLPLELIVKVFGSTEE